MNPPTASKVRGTYENVSRFLVLPDYGNHNVLGFRFNYGGCAALWLSAESLMNHIELAPYFSELSTFSEACREKLILAAALSLVYIIVENTLYARARKSVQAALHAPQDRGGK